MVQARSRSVLFNGSERPPAAPIRLRAGPLSMVFEPDWAFLRDIRLGGHEVLGAVYVAVRDAQWDTVPPVVSDIVLTAAEGSFNLAFDVDCRWRDIDFFWRGTITGSIDGDVVYAMDGVARSSFLRNRIGFCALHATQVCSGQACTVEHSDGSVTRGRFPERISPHQPFFDMRAISHAVAHGTEVQLRFAGDIFEMEDQRNWTDASYKTYCTPLALPIPAEIRAGTPVRQSVTLRLKSASRLRPVPESEQARDVVVRVGRTERNRLGGARLPKLGLQAAGHGQPLGELELTRLRELKLDHLRVDLALGQPGSRDALARAATEARALGAALEVALFLNQSAAQDLPRLVEDLQLLRPRVARWLVFHVAEGTTDARWIDLARRHLLAYDGGVPIGAGTHRCFAELNRQRPLAQALDLICYPINPQVHTFDSRSLVETLPIQAETVENARHFVGSLPVVLTPVTLKPGINPLLYGRDCASPCDELPESVDVRQMSLFGAGWTLGSLKYLALAGAHSVTYYETTGWRGVMETEAGSPLPEAFRSLPGTTFPIYHLLADVGEFAGDEVMRTTSTSPLAVEGLGLINGECGRVLLANLTGSQQMVTVEGLNNGADAVASLRRLDETNAELAVTQPEAFRARPGQRQPLSGASLRLALRPYALARLDFPAD